MSSKPIATAVLSSILLTSCAGLNAFLDFMAPAPAGLRSLQEELIVLQGDVEVVAGHGDGWEDVVTALEGLNLALELYMAGDGEKIEVREMLLVALVHIEPYLEHEDPEVRSYALVTRALLRRITGYFVPRP